MIKMSGYNLKWRKYGLKDNPYFITPLTIDGGVIPISKFVGRNEEIAELKGVIEMGGDIRYMIIGEPGVGKTSLLNFVRNEAANNDFFTPIREIEINKPMTGNEFIILTLSAIHEEIKRKDIKIEESLMQRLDALYELTKFGEISNDISNISQLNKYKLIGLFNEVIDKIYPRFKGIIIHYDNLDNISEKEDIISLLGDVRDFLLNKRAIFFFVGDSFVSSVINMHKRISQVFITPPLQVRGLSFEDVKRLLGERINTLRIDENVPTIEPHTEKAVKLLFNLHNGNIREILNSLSCCVISLSYLNTPITIDEDILRDTLFEKARKITQDLTDVEKEILTKILNKEVFTPTEVKRLTNKSLQNISSKYLPKLVYVGAIRLRNVEGRNRFYEVTPEIKWLKLERTENDKNISKNRKEGKIKEILNKSLKEFM